ASGPVAVQVGLAHVPAKGELLGGAGVDVPADRPVLLEGRRVRAVGVRVLRGEEGPGAARCSGIEREPPVIAPPLVRLADDVRAVVQELYEVGRLVESVALG